MFEKWNTFVYELIEAKTKNIEEEPYHKQIEAQMQHLGWLKWRNEICHKENVQIGRTHIQPDITIKKDGEVQFVIEVKRPVYTQKATDVNQLVSYIRQMKTQVGIYIGEHIEIFYDKNGMRDALSVQQIPIELNNKRGARFVEIFSQENFSKETIIDFCEECIEEQHRQESLNKIKEGLIADTQQQVAEALRPYLAEKYNGKFTEDEIKQMLSTIHFSATMDGEIPQTEKIKQTHNTKGKQQTTEIPQEDKPRLLDLPTLPSYFINVKSDLIKQVISDIGIGKDISEIKDLEELEVLKKEVKRIEKKRKMHNTHSCALSKYIEYIKAGLGFQDMEYDAMLVKKGKRTLVTKLDKKESVIAKTPNDKHRAPFVFNMVGLDKGDKIIFEPLNIEVEVFDSKKIIYKGNLYTLTGFCKQFLPDNLRTKSDAYQGPKFFTYQEKTLWKIRLEKESNN
ncbi:MAG: hypothetical protein J6Y39_02585 [Bacteroidaceae bacterium]|nr:hypothetical protein [Bacteroidaceae bacterium]